MTQKNSDTNRRKTRIAVLLSGRGSNFIAIAKKILKGEINGRISLVVSNKPEAPGISKAKSFGFDTFVLSHKGKEREEFDREITAKLKEYDIELVCLAGYMRILSPYFIREFPNLIMNIHPALLPSFIGLDAQKQAFDYGVKITGATVHFVTEDLDAGPIIIQKAAPVYEDDTEETLSKRILRTEHKIYPEAVKLFCDGRLEVVGGKVLIKPK